MAGSGEYEPAASFNQQANFRQQAGTGSGVTQVPSGESAVDRAAMATAASQVEQAVSVIQGLQSIQEKLVSTHGTYQSTEETNTSQVTRVAGLLNG